MEIELLDPSEKCPRADIDLVPINHPDTRGPGVMQEFSIFGVRLRWRDEMNGWRNCFCPLRWDGAKRDESGAVVGTFSVEGRMEKMSVPAELMALERPEGVYQDTRDYNKDKNEFRQEWQAVVNKDHLTLWAMPGARSDPRYRQLLARVRACYGDSLPLRSAAHVSGTVPGYMCGSSPKI